MVAGTGNFCIDKTSMFTIVDMPVSTCQQVITVIWRLNNVVTTCVHVVHGGQHNVVLPGNWTWPTERHSVSPDWSSLKIFSLKISMSLRSRFKHSKVFILETSWLKKHSENQNRLLAKWRPWNNWDKKWRSWTSELNIYSVLASCLRKRPGNEVEAFYTYRFLQIIQTRCTTSHHFTPVMELVSKVFSRVLTNVISFRVFSNITWGSFEGHRKKFGAQTMAKLFTSILVTRITSGLQNIFKKYTVR